MSNTRRPKNPSLADIVKKATPAERIVPLCVAGAMFAEHQRLEADLEAAQEAESTSSPRMNSASESKVIAQRIRGIELEMRVQTYDFTFRQIARSTWAELMAEHPPKDATRERVNLETFRKVAVGASCISPAGMDDSEQLDPFWDGLSAGQQLLLFAAAWEVNEGGISIPFSVNASAALSTSVPSSTTALL